MGISMKDDSFVRFSDIEKKINEIIDAYQDKYLNDVPPFNTINPTLENMCDYLYEKVATSIRESGWLLLVMEMSETPSRVYQVSGFRPGEDYTFL